MSTASSTRVSDSFSQGPEKGHGRIETRHGRVYRNLRLLRGSEWEGLVACVGVVERIREVYNTSVRQWETATEVAYYVCSKRLSAEQLVTISRKHWLIENRCNHVRDTSLHEDANSSRKRPGAMARMRSNVLNILRVRGKKKISLALYENSLSLIKLMRLVI
jgi:predicted transposase YbfD/YdcC